MEIVTSLPTDMAGASGGTKKHVEEWSRLDRLTGMLEHARVEADHWASTTSNSRHHFGKVVDSRARNLADGSVQQKQQTKQLEVFQAHIPGGSVQVIRSHTSTTSSWHNSKSLQPASSGWPNKTDTTSKANKMELPEDDLQFAHNSVNLNSEKTKASIARSLTHRRPPTKTTLLKLNSDNNDFFNDTPTINFDMNGEANNVPFNTGHDYTNNCVGKVNGTLIREDEKFDKKKSISDENLSIISDVEKENHSPWMRTKLRRSLPHSAKIKKKELTKENLDRSELENALQRILSKRPDFEQFSKLATRGEETATHSSVGHKKSLITEESLQQMKLKLKHYENPLVDKEGKQANSHNFTNKESDKVNGDLSDNRNQYKFESTTDDIQNTFKNMSLKPILNLSASCTVCPASESALLSSMMVKKLSGKLNEEKFNNELTTVKNDVEDSRSKFENAESTSKRINNTTVTVTEQPKAKLSDNYDPQIESIKKGKVLQTIESLRNSTNHQNAFEPTALLKANSYFLGHTNTKSATQKGLDDSQEMLTKRHSIACDDAKYMIPRNTFFEKNEDKNPVTVINVKNFDAGDVIRNNCVEAESKKPKKVEFSKTEVHFAAAEPNKVKIVETDEKPPSTMLYKRKKRSVSVSPRTNLPQTRFGDYEKPSFWSTSDSGNTFEDLPSNVSGTTGNLPKDGPPYDLCFSSTTSDNGLAVRISSMNSSPNSRRASWSFTENEQVENKVGYLSKINFDKEGATVIRDANSQPFDKSRISFCDVTSHTEDKTKKSTNSADPRQNGSENFQKKLIVRIGDSGGDRVSLEKYTQKPTFTNSFRNSISGLNANSVLQMSARMENKLKSTSLIIDTMKKSMSENALSTKESRDNGRSMLTSKVSGNEKRKLALEQPSTYITEMNKLQQKYRMKENRSMIDNVVREEISVFKSQIYNTVPGTKNSFARSKLLTKNLPSMLNAFNDLCKTINKVMDEETQKKVNDTEKNLELLEKLSKDLKPKKKKSSQSLFLCDIADENSGDVSDDSLKADEEVRSYMSTAIMEEYENELCGSWSRKRYFKHIKPITSSEQDAISETSHFKPLKSADDKFKAAQVEIKKPKITSVALKPNNEDQWAGERKPQHTTAVLLQNQSSLRTNNLNSKTILNCGENFEKHEKLRQFKNSAKNDSQPVKVIYHNIENNKSNNEKKTLLSKHEINNSNTKPKLCSKDSINSNNGSIRRKNVTNEKDKLFSSGRDSWLNLPKQEGKATTEKQTVDKQKGVIRKKPNTTETVKMEKNSKNIEINGKEETKKSYKTSGNVEERSSRVRKVLSVTRTTSNSSLDSRVNAYELKNSALKTEERNKRRAARISQYAHSKERPKWNVQSSSEDITSENENNCLKSNKYKSSTRRPSPKSKVQRSSVPFGSSNHKRLITKHEAKMQINIFNIKEKANEKRNGTHCVPASKSSSYVSVNGVETIGAKSKLHQKEMINSEPRRISRSTFINNDSRKPSRTSRHIH